MYVRRSLVCTYVYVLLRGLSSSAEASAEAGGPTAVEREGAEGGDHKDTDGGQPPRSSQHHPVQLQGEHLQACATCGAVHHALQSGRVSVLVSGLRQVEEDVSVDG